MKFLAQFKTIPNYVDFCIPELKALLEMHGLDWRVVFQHEFLSEPFSSSSEELAAKEEQFQSTSTSIHYAYIARKLAGKPVGKRDIMPECASEISHLNFMRFPFVYLEFPSREVALHIIQQSILLEVYIEVISEGSSYEELISAVNSDILRVHNEPDEKISFEVDPYNQHLTWDEILDRINLITDKLSMWGKIDLKNPSKKFWVMERHIDSFTRHTDNSITSSLLDIFFGVEVGRSSSCHRNQQKENFFLKYELKNRAYLGPTSTDNILSFLMCNQGKARTGSLVLDPFVGSASLLIPPSHYGAVCFGGDLDPRILHGYGVGRINAKSPFVQKNGKYCNEMEPKIMLNFEQYELVKPTILRMDCMDSNLRSLEAFDAIICDPPYGYRAMTRTANKNGKKSKSKKNKKDSLELVESGHAPIDANQVREIANEIEGISLESSSNKEEKQQGNSKEVTEVVPISESQSGNQTDKQQKEVESENSEWNSTTTASTAQNAGRLGPTEVVSVDSIVRELIELGDRILAVSGRLVFLYPILREGFSKVELVNNLLNHSNFEVIDISENTLSDKKSRLLITMQKKKSNILPKVIADTVGVEDSEGKSIA